MIESSKPCEQLMPTGDWKVRQISDNEFTLLQNLIQREAGIYLSPAKKPLVMGRLNRRLRELGLETYEDYYLRLRDDAKERLYLLDAISTNETSFFRESMQFSFLENKVFPLWKREARDAMRSRRIRVWSAGCSTGEEPYSLAMVLLDYFPATEGWSIEILASDLSNRALETARKGVWPIERSKEIPKKYLKNYLLRGTGSHSGEMKARSSISGMIRFERINLAMEDYPVTGQFDLIFCRNVLIYFDPRLRVLVVHRLMEYLAPAGYLFVGHAESLSDVTNRLRSVIPAVYTHAKARKSALNVERVHGDVRSTPQDREGE